MARAATAQRRASATGPSFSMTPIQQAIAAHQAGRLGEAEALYRQVLARDPREFDALHMLGIIHAQRDDYEEAERLLRAAVAIDDKVPPCLQNFGNVLSKLERYDEAVAIYNKALALAPHYAPLYSDRGNAQKELGQHAAALASYDRAIALAPNLTSAHGGRGDALRELGRLTDALAAYRKAIEIDPHNASAYFSLTQSVTSRPGDPHLAAMQALAADTGALSKSDRIFLDFALAKAYADLKDYARAFRHLSAANAAKRASIHYDEHTQLSVFERAERIFTPELMTAKSGGGVVSRRPIFVIGMPRSGTTLIEQIIASHPAVYGAGELSAMADAITSVVAARTALRYPEAVPTLDRDAIAAIGADYLRRIDALAPSAERITDKLPKNFLFAGLIHLALPDAVIIHSVRDPVDTCLSCFSQLFTSMQYYSYDLAELGRYYAGYRRLMQHWVRVLPPGRMLEVRYEDVVADLEAQARRILDHCGLVWDDRCLNFYKAERPVRTASVTQVRQPIYANSVKRSQPYAEFLGPLLKELGKVASG
jgi:tetratricopeptide (TPR) repeat protein